MKDYPMKDYDKLERFKDDEFSTGPIAYFPPRPASFIQVVNADDAPVLARAVTAYGDPELVIVNGELHYYGAVRNLSKFWQAYNQVKLQNTVELYGKVP